jgi:hypothetical protein
MNYAAIKTKHKTKLNVESDLKTQLSSITPNIKGICEDTKKNCPSH